MLNFGSCVVVAFAFICHAKRKYTPTQGRASHIPLRETRTHLLLLQCREVKCGEWGGVLVLTPRQHRSWNLMTRVTNLVCIFGTGAILDSCSIKPIPIKKPLQLPRKTTCTQDNTTLWDDFPRRIYLEQGWGHTYTTEIVLLHHEDGGFTQREWCFYTTEIVLLHHENGGFTQREWCFYTTEIVLLHHENGGFTQRKWWFYTTKMVVLEGSRRGYLHT